MRNRLQTAQYEAKLRSTAAKLAEAARAASRLKSIADNTSAFSRSASARKAAEAEIFAAMEYRSGEGLINTVYMGSMAHAIILAEVGLTYGGDHSDFAPRLRAASPAVVARVKDHLQWIIHFMREHPVRKCRCCGQIVQSNRRGRKS